MTELTCDQFRDLLLDMLRSDNASQQFIEWAVSCMVCDWSQGYIDDALRTEIEEAEKKELERINWKPYPVMPKVNGKSFRCHCGANVFTAIAEKKYECNGCQEWYIGE